MVSRGQEIKYFSFVFVCGKYILFTLSLKLIHKRVGWDGKSLVCNCGVEQSQEITQGSNLWFQVHHVCTFTCYKNELTLDEISFFHFIFGYVLPLGTLHHTLEFVQTVSPQSTYIIEENLLKSIYQCHGVYHPMMQKCQLCSPKERVVQTANHIQHDRTAYL